MDDVSENTKIENGQAAISEAIAATPEEDASTTHNNILSALHIEEPAKIRSKLRTFVVLLALYVS
jgi:hypothetical protein